MDGGGAMEPGGATKLAGTTNQGGAKEPGALTKEDQHVNKVLMALA